MKELNETSETSETSPKTPKKRGRPVKYVNDSRSGYQRVKDRLKTAEYLLKELTAENAMLKNEIERNRMK